MNKREEFEEYVKVLIHSRIDDLAYRALIAGKSPAYVLKIAAETEFPEVTAKLGEALACRMEAIEAEILSDPAYQFYSNYAKHAGESAGMVVDAIIGKEFGK